MDYPLACDNCVIGEIYSVPCIGGRPIVGEPHVDNDHFNHTPCHYHVDSRFENGPSIEFDACKPGRIKHQPMLCIRDQPVDWTSSRMTLTTIALYLRYNSVTVTNRCPHKRMPIHNGVCSGHRLKWLPDGTIAHKPPYSLVLKSDDHRVISEYLFRSTLDEEFNFLFTDAYHGFVNIEMQDVAGAIVTYGLCVRSLIDAAPTDTLRIFETLSELDMKCHAVA
jgi:hypothetical protein